MITKHINRFRQIDQLIRQNATGNADEFGRKLGVSRRQVYYLIDELKDLGLQIEYDREKKSYYYLKSYQINIALEIKELSQEELMKTNGKGPFFRNYLIRKFL